MSDLHRSIGKPLMIVVAVAYLCALAALLLFWHVSPDLLLALTLGGIGLVIIVLRPYWGLHLFLMTLFVETIGGAAQGFTAVKAVGIIVVSGWLLSLAVRRKPSFHLARLVVLCALFLGWCGISLIYAFDAESAVSRLFTFTQLALSAIMFASAVDSPGKLRGILAAIVLWVFVATCVALVEYYLGWSRVASGPVGNRNLLATYINAASACALLLHQATKSRGIRILLALSLPVLFLGLALTLSRTGLIVQTMILVMVWYRIAREKGFLLLAGSSAALCLITLLLPAAFYNRVSTIVPAIEHKKDTFGLRWRVWKIGVQMIEDRPLVGVGPGNFIITSPRYNHGDPFVSRLSAHNTFVSVGAETGLVGLTLYVALLLVGLRHARATMRAAKAAGNKELEILAVAAEICLFVVIAAGITGSVETLKILWLLLGISYGVGSMSRQGRDPRPAEGLAGRARPLSLTLAPGDSR